MMILIFLEINFQKRLFAMGTCGQHTNHYDPGHFDIQYGKDSNQTQLKHRRIPDIPDDHLNKKLKDIFEKLEKEKSMYKDPTMETEPILLRTENSELKCTFQRPYQFLRDLKRQNPPEVFDPDNQKHDSIKVKDQIMQYFGVFLSFLVNKPKLINQIIHTEKNTFGLHCVSAYIGGIKHDIVIDDLFLCHDNQPLFSQLYKKKYIWPLILEKAWLKIRGSLDHRVEQGVPEDVFDTFLRFPIEKINLENEEVSLETIIKNNLGNLNSNNCYYLTSKKSPKHKLGISGRKSFILLDAFYLKDKLLVYLRNPIPDRFNFRGCYANVDDFEDLKKKVKERNLTVQPGNFFVDEYQFIEQFSELNIVHYIPNNLTTFMSFNSKNREQFFIGVQLAENGGDLTLAIDQHSKQPVFEEEFHPITYQVIHIPSKQMIGGMENNEGCFGHKKINIIDRIIEHNASGKYLVRLKKKDHTHKVALNNAYIVGSYQSMIKFHIANHQELQVDWQEFLINEGRKKLQPQRQKASKKEDCLHVVCWIGDIVFIYIQKINSKKDSLKIEVNFSELENLECISHPQIRKSDDYHVLPMKHNLLIVFEKINLSAATHIKRYHLESF